MSTQTIRQRPGGDPSVAGRFAKVFPFAKVQRKDLPMFIAGFDDEVKEILASPDALSLIPNHIPRVIGMLHSIIQSDVCIFRFHGILEKHDLHVFLPEPLFPIGIADGKPVIPVWVAGYMDHFTRVPVTTTAGRDLFMSDYLTSVIRLAELRYHNFPYSTWVELVTAFGQHQVELVRREAIQFLCREWNEAISAPPFLVLLEELLARPYEVLESFYRAFNAYDPKTLQQWFQLVNSTPPLEPVPEVKGSVLKVTKRKSPKKNEKNEAGV